MAVDTRRPLGECRTSGPGGVDRRRRWRGSAAADTGWNDPIWRGGPRPEAGRRAALPVWWWPGFV